MDASWNQITIDDIRRAFPTIQFKGGGIVDDSYAMSNSIIIPNKEVAVLVLEFLQQKILLKNIGGDPNIISDLWNSFSPYRRVVKMSMPQFNSADGEQTVCFTICDNNVFDISEYPPVVVYSTNKARYPKSPVIWERNATGEQSWDESLWNNFFQKTQPIHSK
jgi:hypothetical protein